MIAAKIALVFHFVSGPIGLVVMSRPPRMFVASRTIDHPSIGWRRFYRVVLFGLCDFVSFLVSPTLIYQFVPTPSLTYHPELIDAFVVLHPLPLALALYWLHARTSRWFGH